MAPVRIACSGVQARVAVRVAGTRPRLDGEVSGDDRLANRRAAKLVNVLRSFRPELWKRRWSRPANGTDARRASVRTQD
jgi:5-enolpyruvylshikimate-3-phosphate synthase